MPRTSPLSPEHAELIRASAISPEVATQRGYKTVTTKADLETAGFAYSQCRAPGLLIPIWSVRGEVALHQLRPNVPRIKNGKSLKYETPRGACMALDVPPQVRPALNNPTLPLVITEGVRKADAGVSHGITTIDILGVWNWRGRNDVGGLTALADWESIALNGRRIFICFDSDVMTKVAVHAALARLKSFLESRKAIVSLIYLPGGADGEKVGLDDFLAAGNSKEDLFRLATPNLAAPPASAGARGPYEFHPEGIVLMKDTNNGPVSVTIANFTARITAEISHDDGDTRSLNLEVTARCGEVETTFAIPADQFPTMNWVVPNLGIGAVVHAGHSAKDHARAAIQLFSDRPQKRTIYTHTGWRQVAGAWVYCHAEGAIGAAGAAPGIEVVLPATLNRFALPAPSDLKTTCAAVQASLKILDLAPKHVVVPAYAAIWRSVLMPADFSLHYSGKTGVFKTELAALAQQHFGAEMDARSLPASWSSTGNALEAIAFAAKEALLVIDDFAPTGASGDVQRYHREADRIFRAQGNRSGRHRLSADATLKPTKTPRGLALSTGEDIPRMHSVRARVLIVEVSEGDIPKEKLSFCQRDAHDGAYASAMAAFLQFLAADREAILRRFMAQRDEHRARAMKSDGHRRTPYLVADLAAAFDVFLDFARAVLAVTQEEARQLAADAWTALVAAAGAQEAMHAAVDPVRRFFELLTSQILSGNAHLADVSGGAPANPQSWGWRTKNSATAATGEWNPLGRRIGWVADDSILLVPDAAYSAVSDAANGQGDPINLTAKVLWKRLDEAGHLLLKETKRRRFTVRRVVEGTKQTVLCIRKTALHSDEEAPASTASILPPDTEHVLDAAVDAGAVHDEGSGHHTVPERPAGEGSVAAMDAGDALWKEPSHSEHEVAPEACFGCTGRSFWISIHGNRVCGRCHPPACPELVERWEEVRP